MKLWLNPKVFAAVYGPDLVLLDAATGDYQLLAGAADLAQIQDDGAGLEVEDRALCDALHDLDAATDARPSRLRPAPPPPPRRSVPLEAPFSVTMSDRWTMTLGWFDMVAAYHGRRFPALLAAAGPTPPPDALVDVDRIARSALAFDRQSPWTPFQGDCLYRCLMLRRMLRRQGLGARWVFGVRTWPFYAHCWLQVGDLVLTDYAERLIGYSPIMAL